MVDVPGNVDSPEAVAFALMRDCLQASGKLYAGFAIKGMTEDEVLSLYARCMATVKGQINVPPSQPSRASSGNLMGR